jgi:hypothetical protein
VRIAAARWGAGRPELLAGAGAATAAGLAAIAAARPELDRPLLALVLGVALGAVAIGWPLGAAVATLLFLPFLALLRRVLILETGWESQDPLLLVGPAVVGVLVVVLFVSRGRPVTTNALSRLIVGVLVLAVVQCANPAGGGLGVGLQGLLFIGAPLLWFFVGRELATRRTVALLLVATVGIACLEALYGLLQTSKGLPEWDVLWLLANGYYALNVGGVIRAWGTFSSSAEYVLYLGTGLSVCVALALHHGRRWLVPVPLLTVALFLGSGRAAMAATTVAAIVLVSLAWLPGRTAVAAIAALLVCALLALSVAGPLLARTGAVAGNPLAAHQVAGLTDPLNPQASTAGRHTELFLDGLRSGVTHPLGFGTGTTNVASQRSERSVARPTEIDVSDTFVSLGLLGGLVYALVVALTLRLAVVRYLAHRDPLVLAVLGLLVTTLGQWLTGGHYALAPLTWFLVGWLAGGRWAGGTAR